MRRWIGLWLVVGLVVVMAGRAVGQTESWQRPPAQQPGYPGQGLEPVGPPRQPDQPVNPQYPTVERRIPLPGQPGAAGGPGLRQPPPVPFVLSAEEESQRDRALAAWELAGTKVRTFQCTFTRWEYDSVFGKSPTGAVEPKIDQGVLQFGAPDKGLFEVRGQHPEKWVCDGKAIYKYEFARKELIEYRLPPDLQGKAITNGPLPFLFGAEAQKLKQRYYLRLLPTRNPQEELALEAYPRHQPDAAEFSKAELILKTRGMLPFALQLTSPNGKDRTVYQFENIKINRGFLEDIFQPNPFAVSTPRGWKKKVEEPPSPGQASRGATAGRR
jgi:TIGR03009 family protein